MQIKIREDGASGGGYIKRYVEIEDEQGVRAELGKRGYDLESMRVYAKIVTSRENYTTVTTRFGEVNVVIDRAGEAADPIRKTHAWTLSLIEIESMATDAETAAN